MKKIFVLGLGAALVVSSCGTYTGTGAYAGVTLGSILGSAIGGIADGPRGSDIGTIVGMAGGAIIGGAIGAQADQARQRDYEASRVERTSNRPYQTDRNVSVRSSESLDVNDVFDEYNTGDDRLFDFSDVSSVPTVGRTGSDVVRSSSIEIRNARFLNKNRDYTIRRGEVCKVVFEIYNCSSNPLYDVRPLVVETTGNRHIVISPSILIERIGAGKGIRYTALVKADNRLKNGAAKINISVAHGRNTLSGEREFTVYTRK